MSYVELTNKSVKVRKPRGCIWCAERIPVGTQAQYRAYRFDGDFQTDYMHPECYQALLTVNYQDLDDGWEPGQFKRGTVEER